MTDTSPDESPAQDDDLRQHPQDPAEGADPADAAEEDVPREHPQDPAEG